MALAGDLRNVLHRSLVRFSDERAHYAWLERYAIGLQDPPYMPKHAHREYASLAKTAVLNFLPLIVDAVAQQLYVEGYRKPDSPDDDSSWEWWSANSLDAWQHSVHRDTLTYGVAYVRVLPGKRKVPQIRPISPLSMSALYEDPIHDEWPQFAVHVDLDYSTGEKRCRATLLDDEFEHVYLGEHWTDAPDLDSFTLTESRRHGLGVCPVVRFRNQLSTSPNVAPRGDIEALIPTQDRLNSLTLTASLIAQFASFRQRWASGLVIPRDPETGEPVDSFNSAVNRVWVTETPDARFGEFSESDIGKILLAVAETIKHLAAISQVPPVYLLGEIVNISAEALAAAEAGLQRKCSEKRTVYGEAWAQVMRLATAASTGRAIPEDAHLNRIVWRDTEARSLASTVDALGKLSQMLQVPPEALWERIPGINSSDVAAWKKMSKEADSFGNMLGMLQAQSGRAGVEKTQAEAKGADNAKQGTNVPGKATTSNSGYGTPSRKPAKAAA
ncbi:phage portal protein [Glycomyces sp. NPDC048151]|uniref:phage portal protein n=1 Tax=Glycomyces sp. NPDC048151 TaxID=3364002 RepID=UPI00371A3C91